MKAIIIAGGRGERLRPLTDSIPKPMVEVAGKPILEHILLLLKQHNITNLIIAVCYLPDVITDYFGNGSKLGFNITYTFEDPRYPMGTAGAIFPAKKLIKDKFITTYADILRELDVTEMIKQHTSNKAFGTINIYKRFGKDPKSMIITKNNNQIVEFKERPKPAEIPNDFVWANGSLYIFEQEVFDFIPENKPSDFGKNIFPSLLSSKKPLYAYPSSGYFVDIGNKEKLEKARKTFEVNYFASSG